MEKKLVKLGILRLTEKRVDKWIKQGKTDLLLFVLDYGLYNMREQIITALREEKDPGIIKHITKFIDDEVRTVSEATIKTIEKIGVEHLKSNLLEKLESKKEYWIEKENQD